MACTGWVLFCFCRKISSSCQCLKPQIFQIQIQLFGPLRAGRRPPSDGAAVLCASLLLPPSGQASCRGGRWPRHSWAGFPGGFSKDQDLMSASKGTLMCLLPWISSPPLYSVGFSRLVLCPCWLASSPCLWQLPSPASSCPTISWASSASPPAKSSFTCFPVACGSYVPV